jgi:hypothetical protein
MASNAPNKNKPTESLISASIVDDSIMTWLKANGLFTFATLTGVALFIASFVTSMGFLGTKEDWNNIQKKVTTIISLSVAASIALGFAAVLYFISNQEKAVYYTIIMSTLAFGMSYASVAVASISK